LYDNHYRTAGIGFCPEFDWVGRIGATLTLIGGIICIVFSSKIEEEMKIKGSIETPRPKGLTTQYYQSSA